MTGMSRVAGGAQVVLGRVLVIESEQAERHQLRRILQGAGAVVDTASSQRQAYARLQHHRYAAVVSGVSVGGTPVFQLIENAQQAQCPVFVLLTDDPYFERPRSLPVEAVLGVLSRPVVAGELVELVARAVALSKQRRPSTTPPANDQQRGSVLILEDNPADAELARMALASVGYARQSVVEVQTLQDALKLVDQHNFSLALVDLQLPDASGLDVIRQLYNCNSNLPIVVASGLQRDICEQALACGAQEVADKSHLMAELPGAVKRALLRKSADQAVRYRASYDAMTTLFNRSHFVALLDRAVARMRRNSSSCAVIYIDLDGFKPINDRYGHSAGDHALRAVATRLMQSLRDCDSAARLGGDEFAVLIEDVYDRAALRPVAQRILRMLIEPITLPDGHQVRVSGSLGIALCPMSGSTALELMDAADAAMFVAKDAGGNQYCFAADVADSPSDSHNRLANDLKTAVANSDFYLLFQPQVDLNTHRIMGVEALLRWRRRNGPAVGPDQFVPVLEQTGMIVDVGAWVLREAVHSAAQWSLRHGRRVRVAVNISPQQLEQPGFPGYVHQVLREASLDPELLELEITETLLMRDTGTIQRTLSELRGAGVRLVLDDFGTGYASLSYLRRYAVDGLKIDRSFIQPVVEEGHARVLVGGIIDLAHQLNLEVVAEGVEKLAQVRYLRDRRCDACQGFLFGRPHFLGDSRSSGVWSARSSLVPVGSIPPRVSGVAMRSGRATARGADGYAEQLAPPRLPSDLAASGD